MRGMLIATSFMALASFSYADEPKKADAPPEQKSEITLKVGDPAPKLKADRWLQGSEVTNFAPDKFYVVEFWATWCGPCIMMMPHMAEMQAEYRDKGVTFIGFSARDPGDHPKNNLESVSALVKKRGEKLGYTFAYGDSRVTYDAWMTAAGENGIPCSFVVDKAGKIAYIGHPMYLDFVLPKLVAGKWTADDAKTISGIEKEIDAVFALSEPENPDPEAFLKALADFNAKHPWTARIPYFIGPKIAKLALAKKYDEACRMAKDALAKAVNQGDTATLGLLAYSLRALGVKENKDLAAVAVQAVEANLKIIGDSDYSALTNAIETHLAVGDSAKAGAYAAKAIAAAKTPFQISRLLESPAVKDNKELLAGVLKAAEAQLKDAGDLTYYAYWNIAETHFALGDKTKAKEFGEKAIAAAKTPGQKAELERRVAKYKEEKKEGK